MFLEKIKILLILLEIFNKLNAIFKQSIKYSICSYFGCLLGALSTIFIYPLDYTFYGTIRYFFSISEIALPIVLIGMSQANVRFYKELKAKNRQHQLLSFSFFFTTLLCLLFYLFHPIFKFCFPNLYIWKYKFFIFIFIFILAINQIINKYLTNLKRIVIPGIIEAFLPKLGVIIAFYYFISYKISINSSILIFIIFFFIASILYIIYLIKIDNYHFSYNFIFLKKNQFYKRFFSFGFFTLLGAICNILILRIDSIIIFELIGKKFNGYYAIYLSIINLVSLPTFGIYSISTPIIRDYINKNNFKELAKFYKKNSFNLFFFGSFLFSMICCSIDSIFNIINHGDELTPYLSLIYIFGFSTLFDLATGFSSQIISMSYYYRYNVYFMMVILFLNILLNFIFVYIFHLGLIGVGYVNSISLFVYNIMKLIFNYQRFRLNPFSFKMIKVFILVIMSLFINFLIPKYNYEILNAANKLLTNIIFFLIGTYYFKLLDFNDLNIISYIKYIKNNFNKKN